MPRNVLNIAAGFLPLVTTDFAESEITKLVNFDPLNNSGSSFFFKAILHTIRSMPEPFENDIEYKYTKEEVQEAFNGQRIQLTIAVSPFGFSMVEGWTDALMESGSYVVALGNKRNRFLDGERVFSGEDIRERYENVKTKEDVDQWVMQMIREITVLYPSQKTNLGGDTGINSWRVFRKIKS